MAQCLDRAQLRRFSGGIDAEENAHRRGKEACSQHSAQTHLCGESHQGADTVSARHTDNDTYDAAQQRDNGGLRQELEQNGVRPGSGV